MGKTLTPILCTQCGAPIKPGAGRCAYCGTSFVLDADDDGVEAILSADDRPIMVVKAEDACDALSHAATGFASLGITAAEAANAFGALARAGMSAGNEKTKSAPPGAANT